MSGTNALMRPTQNPATRFAGPAAPPIGLSGPQMPASALQVPAATPAPASVLPPVQPAPAAAVGMPVAPPPAGGGAPPGGGAPDTTGRISARVPVPETDFHPDHHDDLHKAMGPAFDKPEASQFVRQAYDDVRAIHPHVDARAALLTARDAWHAVQHGLATHEQAHHALRNYPALFAKRS
jgi:hypothetical protein